MSISPPTPATPDPDDVARGLADLEHYVAAQAPAPALPAAVAAPAQEGDTKRVRELRARVAEAHRLVELQDDDAPLLVDTAKVRKHRRKVAEAARLYELAQDPAVLAWRDQKVRRVTTVMVMSAAAVALAVSSIGVQASVAEGLTLGKGSAGWWAAFGVEPALSLPLLAAVGVQAYSAMRGRVVDRKSPEGRKLFRTEALLLGLTLVLNCWPAITWSGFDLLPLIVHALGPVAAVTAIWVLPTLWAVLAALPAPGLTGALTGLTYRANALPLPLAESTSGKAGKGEELAPWVAQARCLIAAGQLPPHPSANRLQKVLRCGMDVARVVRDELAGGA